MHDHTPKWYIPFWNPTPERIHCTVCHMSLKDVLDALDGTMPQPQRLHGGTSGAERKAALWDSLGAPALALLRQYVAWVADVNGISLMRGDPIDQDIRVLLARADKAQP